MLFFRLLAFVFALSFAAASHANPKQIGILGGKENRNVHAADRVLEAYRSGDVVLFPKPNNNPEKPVEPAKTVKGRELLSEPYLQNRQGIKVYGYQPYGWYMVAHGGRAWWTEVLPNMVLYDYHSLVSNRQSYLNSWDGMIYDEPGGTPRPVDKSQIASHHRDHPPVEVSDKQKIGDNLWFRIKILQSKCYEFDRPDKVIITGWVPAYAPDNEQTIWFKTRPCG